MAGARCRWPRDERLRSSPHLRRLALRVLFVFFLLSCLPLSFSAPVYDCAFDPRHLDVCNWSTEQLQSRLTQLTASSSTSPSSPLRQPLIAFIDRLVTEDVDGNVFLSLEKHEVDMLLDKDSSQLTPQQKQDAQQSIMQLMQQLVADDAFLTSSSDSRQPHSPPPTPPNSPSSPTRSSPEPDCNLLLRDVPEHEQALLTLLAAEATALQQSKPVPAKGYTGQWPSSAHKRVFPLLLTASASHRSPRLIVLLGQQESDLSFPLYAFSPDALVLQVVTDKRSDSEQAVRDKLKRRREASSGKGGGKRGKTANVVLNLPLQHALCLLQHSGIHADLAVLGRQAFPVSASCCSWWETDADGRQSTVAGQAVDYPMMRDFALLTGHRLYADQPLFVLSSAASPVHCEDRPGHLVQQGEALLGMYMIVKNEEGGMTDTLSSILPHLDALTVLDTGSTDRTVEIIESMLQQYAVRGRVHHGQFVDFSTTRNEALRLASAELNTTFMLMLNGDDSFVGGEQLRTFLSYRVHQCGPSDEMYLLSVDYEGHKLAWSERVFRTSNHQYADWPTSHHWHYAGLTHESYTQLEYAGGQQGDYAMTYAGRPISGQPDDGFRFHVYHTYVRDHRDKLKERAAKDAQLLLAQLRTLPDDPRTMYYLSHSYDIQEEFEQAFYWHERRTRRVVNQFRSDPQHPPVADKEECTCLLRLGKIALYRLPEQHSREAGEEWLQLARALCTDQIESRFYLAEQAAARKEWRKALAYAQEADKLKRSGVGMMHVLESDTVNQRLPQMVEVLRHQVETEKAERGGGKGEPQGKKGKAGGSGQKAKGKKGKKSKQAAKDEL